MHRRRVPPSAGNAAARPPADAAGRSLALEFAPSVSDSTPTCPTSTLRTSVSTSDCAARTGSVGIPTSAAHTLAVPPGITPTAARPFSRKREHAVHHMIDRAIAAVRHHKIVSRFRSARRKLHRLPFGFLHDDIGRPAGLCRARRRHRTRAQDSFPSAGEPRGRRWSSSWAEQYRDIRPSHIEATSS